MRRKPKDIDGPRESKYAARRESGKAGYDYTEGFSRRQIEENWSGVPYDQRKRTALKESPSRDNPRGQGFVEPHRAPTSYSQKEVFDDY